MRKGALNRFSIAVATLSLASVIPVAYYHYKNTIPSAYVCDESITTSGELTCTPYSSDDYRVNDITYSFDHRGYIKRPVGNLPDLIISKAYIDKYYKHISVYINRNIQLVPELLDKEYYKLDTVLRKASINLTSSEDEYKTNTAAFVTTVCIILPLLVLILLYILRFLVTFIIHGRRKEVNT